MGCNHFERDFSKYIEGELAREDREALRFHLNGCSRCLTRIEDMQRTLHSVRSLPSVVPPAGFEDALQYSIHQQITRDLYAQPWWSMWTDAFDELSRIGRRRTAQAVFAMGLVLILAISVVNWNGASNTSITLLTLPAPVEPEPAMSRLTAPLPVEAKLASFMITDASYTARMNRTLESPSTSMSDIVPGPSFEALLPLPSGELAVTGASPTDADASSDLETGRRKTEAPIFQPFNSSERVNPSRTDQSRRYNAYVTGFGATPVNQQQGSQRYILPTVSSKRINRVSF